MNLDKKIEQAIRLLQSADKIAAEHGQPLKVAYSGGKDSDVILELAKMAGVNYRAIYKNTTIDPPGTIKHVREMGVEVIQPKLSFKQVIEKKGFPNRWRRFCCSVLKEYKVLDYAIIGVRRDESRARSERYQEPEICRVYNKHAKVRQYLPILEWTNEDIAAFVKMQAIKCHGLYYDKDGAFHPERRLGCMCCPLQSKLKRIDSFKQYPNMVKYYLRAGQRFLDGHPQAKIKRQFGDVYDWFTSQVYCDGERQFKEKFGPTLFDDGIDCKEFLEKQFNINL